MTAASNGHRAPAVPVPASTPEADADDNWVCPHCRRGACHRCSDRNCRCCAGTPDDPALKAVT